MKTIEKLVRKALNGLNSAENYLSEDLDAICDETMCAYAEETLDEVKKGVEAAETVLQTLEKKKALYEDALIDISMYVGYHHVEFEDSKECSLTLRDWAQKFVYKFLCPITECSLTLRDWAQKFVDKYADMDWEKTDYIILVGEYAVEMVSKYKKQSKKQYSVKYVLGMDAVREYNDCIENREKWNESSLCDCGSVVEGNFNTPEELAAYEEGIADANGWLEAEKMMTDEEWEKYLRECEEEEED